jgi:hypothetical protein
VRNAEGWKRQDVELGLSSFTDVAVRSGARPGDVIALRSVL